MATSTTKRPARAAKGPTRRDREFVRQSAASANASMDLRPAGTVALAVVGVVVFTILAAVLVPGGSALGGPLQASRLETGASLTTVHRTKGKAVTFGIPVSWNTAPANAVLEDLQPIGAEGVEIIRAAVPPLGSVPVDTAKGFPPSAVVLTPLPEFPIPPGTGEVDGFQIVVGLKGTGVIPAFALAYRVGSERFVAILGHGVLLCKTKTCEPGVEIDADQHQRATLAAFGSVVASPGR